MFFISLFLLNISILSSSTFSFLNLLIKDLFKFFSSKLEEFFNINFELPSFNNFDQVFIVSFEIF